MNLSWLRSTKADVSKIMQVIDSEKAKEHPDSFVVESLREVVFDVIRREYPLGARCRVCHGTEYDHLIVGHQYGATPVISVHPINPIRMNDKFTNWDIKDVHVLGKE